MKTCAGRLLDKVAAFCRQEKLIHPGDHLLIACSGGPDSLTLLDILASLRHVWNLTLTVCYVHHGIRPSADDEVGIVRKAAEERDCGFMWDFADVPRIAAGTHQSLETAGRNERYRILRQCAVRCHASAIAVAHQQNDQAETVLQHLLRGSGLRGLGGIRPKNGDIIRPLLALTRRDIEDYIKERGLVPCEDETNQSRDYGRNRIRLELIPQLEAYNPDLLKRPQVIAANKMDACYSEDDSNDVIARLKAEFEPKGIKVFPISAVSRQGVKELLWHVNDLLKTVDSAPVVFQKEFEIEYQGDRNLPYTVTRADDGAYVVEGPRIEKMLGYTNLDSEKGFDFFQKFLKNTGILEDLEKAGISEGDTVRMYGLEFDYYK